LGRVSDLPAFGTRLRRLLEQRGAAGPAASAAGGEPDDLLLRRLAAELGLHACDLFLFAGRPVPEDLAPARLDGPWKVNSLLTALTSRFDTAAHAQLRRFVDELPVSPAARIQPFPADGQEATAGVILGRLLNNRNIRVDNGVLVMIGGGPFLATSTYRKICAGVLPLRDEHVTAFARTAGIPVADLTALLGLDNAEVPWNRSYPWPSDLAALGWAARRLDDEQLQAAIDYAHTLVRD
jgi:hypothetical protein